jgi:hypothetical protein
VEQEVRCEKRIWRDEREREYGGCGCGEMSGGGGGVVVC